MKTFRKIVLVVVASALLSITVGCNTVRGAGRDIEKGGQAIEKAADAAQY